jgi:hypothetical protein
MTHRIELDRVKKWRSQSEWRWVNRARFRDVEETGDHKVIVALARKMLDAGIAGDVEVWRGETLCFACNSVANWADQRVWTGDQPEHLRKAAK